MLPFHDLDGLVANPGEAHVATAVDLERTLDRGDQQLIDIAGISIQAQLGPNPRVLADDVWAKLLWAGLNLEKADLPRGSGDSAPFYPLALVRAVVLPA